MAAILEALRVPLDGRMAQYSARLASYLLSGRGAGRQQICLQGSLNGSVVLLPVYALQRPWRWSSQDMPCGAQHQAARLSLLAMLATWRAGGTVAPVTPELLEPARDREGRLLIPELGWEHRELPSVLQQWQPSFVLGFGALDDVLERSVAPDGFWLRHVEVKYLRLKLEQVGASPSLPAGPSSFKNDVALELSDVAVSLANGHLVTFEDLLSAVKDPAGHLPTGDEATIIRLLRLASQRFRSATRALKPRRWPVTGPPWPPRRLPKLASEWTAVDALDSTRQGRTLDGEVYYWNRTTNETTWHRPWGGRRSKTPPPPLATAGDHGARRRPRRPRPPRLGMALCLEMVGSQGVSRRGRPWSISIRSRERSRSKMWFCRLALGCFLWHATGELADDLGEELDIQRLQLLQVHIGFVAPDDQDPNIIRPKPKKLAPVPFPQPYQPRLADQAFIPSIAFVLGVAMCALGRKTLGMLAIYFAGQSSFALYMKLVLSEETISRELNLRGMPAAFLVTAIQQVVAFCSLGLLMLVLRFSPQPYVPRKLTTLNEVLAVLFFALAVAVNIGLNNFSMSLLPVSLNMVIRSCIPLVTLLLQQLARQLQLLDTSPANCWDALLMSVGVAGAAITALAESETKNEETQQGHLGIGVLMCCLGDIAAATTLVLAAAFSSTWKPPLSPLDTVFYTALPCAIALLPASLYASHPINWPNAGTLTDWEVYQKVHQLNPGTIFLVLLSGVVSAGYNYIQYTVVQTLSATHAAFAGNFNKAATISLSIFLGLELLPGGHWSTVMVLGIAGNILAFTAWSYLQAIRAPKGEVREPVR